MSRTMSTRQISRQPFIVAKQLAKMTESPHFTVVQKSPDSYEVFYILLHPQGGHYANQKHVLEFKTVYGSGSSMYYFPFNPPNVRFLTGLYHTNISTSGSVCLDILKDSKKWSPQYTIETVMISIIALMDDPNTSSPYNLEPSKHWTRCCREYNDYISGKKLSGKEQIEIKKKIFADYDRVSDAYARKNGSPSNWAEYFPSLLMKDLSLSEKKDNDE
jgi:ubiquitin-protein ligase